MTTPNDRHEDLLNAAIDAVRADHPAPGDVARAAERTLLKLKSEPAAGPGPAVLDCAALQALVPEYLAHKLPASRAVLLEDHAKTCVACRKAILAARSGKVDRAATAPARVKRVPTWRWAAAAVVLVAAVLAWPALRNATAPGGNAEVLASSGPLYRFAGISIAPLRSGETVAVGEEIRTGLGGSAVVELPDGSKIEAAERSSFRIEPAADGTNIRLISGNIIVEAAKQKQGHLYVQTDDCRVAVKGTIFAVNAGLKGSRVSVVEGEVHVAHGGASDVLRPGDQVTTSPALVKVPVADEVAWSRNVDRYVELLGALDAVGREIDQKVAWPGARRSSELLDRVPADTVAYVSIPNAGGSLAEAYELLRGRVRENAALADWWQTRVADGGHDLEIDRAMDKLRRFSAELGSEVVVSLATGAEGVKSPLILATLANPGGFRGFLEAQLRELRVPENDFRVRIVGDADVPGLVPRHGDGDTPGEMLVWLHGDLLAAAFDAAPLQRMLAIEADPADAWSASPFRQRLAAAYAGGVDWLFAVDFQRLMDAVAKEHGGSEGHEALRRTGVLEGRYLMISQRTFGDRRQYSATVDFAGPRQGLAAWPASPGTLGSIRFVSPDATAYAGVLLREPKLMLQDVYALLGGQPALDGAAVPDDVALLLERIAAPLGNEIGFAFDGPVLPVPAWKVVLEVYDPAAFQDGLEQLVAFIQLKTPEAGLSIEQADVGGTVHYTLRSAQPALELHYAFADGYVVLAQRRAFVTQALAQRASGLDLSRSAKFRELVPGGDQPNVSGLFYQDFGGALGPLANLLADARLTPEQRAAIKDAVKPQAGLAILEAQPERIAVTAQQFGTFGSDFVRLFAAGQAGQLLGAAGGPEAGGPVEQDTGEGDH